MLILLLPHFLQEKKETDIPLLAVISHFLNLVNCWLLKAEIAIESRSVLSPISQQQNELEKEYASTSSSYYSFNIHQAALTTLVDLSIFVM